MNTRSLLSVSILCASVSISAASPETPLLPARANRSAAREPEFLDQFHSKMSLAQLPPRTFLAPLDNGPAVFPAEFRSIDGTNNNEIEPLRGSANSTLLRTTTIAYGDGVGSPAGADQQSPREISNLINGQTTSIPAGKAISDFIWQWGQFLDHDMSLSPLADPPEQFPIPVPAGDPQFDPNGTGNKKLPFKRSLGLIVDGIREQINVNTAYIDGSQVYGSDTARAQELRMLDGSGQLKTSANNLLPFNVNGFPNQPSTAAGFFLAGDVRVNETPMLTSLQTVFMREHNFWAATFKAQDPTLDDDGIYFRARAIVGAEIELITYRDFLPLLLGKNALTPYAGYNPDVDAGIANVFQTAAFRVGHTLLSPTLLRLDENNQTISAGNLDLLVAFFVPSQVTKIGIEPYLRGLAKQNPQKIDAFIVDGVRNDVPASFDLASLNIQRGRDHGLPRFNQVRIDYGLPPFTSFKSMLPGNPALQAKFAAAYASVDDIDAWVGCIAEKHRTGAIVGDTIFAILKDQFERLRDGDRFWYESYLDPTTLATVQSQTLSAIIKRNTTITDELQNNVFHLPRNP